MAMRRRYADWACGRDGFVARGSAVCLGGGREAAARTPLITPLPSPSPTPSPREFVLAWK
eukprot:711262-Pleurochrysis_carterae.AAC.2